MMSVVDRAKEKCLSGKDFSKQELIELLDIVPGTEEGEYLRKAAYEVAREITGGKAYLWGAVGIDYAPCPMNCDFCSFGEKWGIVKEKIIYSDDEIIEQVREFANRGVRFIVLRTTEFYDIDQLCEKAGKIRGRVPGEYELILNIGEFGPAEADKMHESGVSGIYHALRLREGKDTPFDPQVRKNTIRTVRDSSLKLISLVEPVGEEHTSEELAEAFMWIMESEACLSGTMARVPVPGTPLGERRMISDEKIAHLTAVFRLAAGRKIPDICVHPTSQAVMNSGANVAVIEKGAIPRDTEFSEDEWGAMTAEKARGMFEKAGYKVCSWEE